MSDSYKIAFNFVVSALTMFAVGWFVGRGAYGDQAYVGCIHYNVNIGSGHFLWLILCGGNFDNRSCPFYYQDK